MAKFKVYVFKDDETKDYSYILATNEELAQLYLKQFTHRPFSFVKSRDLDNMDELKAFMIYNQIKPF